MLFDIPSKGRMRWSRLKRISSSNGSNSVRRRGLPCNFRCKSIDAVVPAAIPATGRSMAPAAMPPPTRPPIQASVALVDAAPLRVNIAVPVPAVPKVETSPNILADVAMLVTLAVAMFEAKRAFFTFLLGVWVIAAIIPKSDCSNLSRSRSATVIDTNTLN